MAQSKGGEKLNDAAGFKTRDDSRVPGPERLLRRLVRDGLDVPTAARLVAILDERRG
jgi:hypothetical protein